MKKIVFTFAIVLTLLVSCNNNNKKQSEEKVEITTSSKNENNDPYYGRVRQINSEEFKQLVFDYTKNPDVWLYKGTKPCVLDFYADWCRPCKMISPYLDELAKEYAGKVNFYKIDTQTEQELSQVFNIQSIPLVVFCGMKTNPVGTTGAMEKSEYKKYVDSLLVK